MIKRFLLALCTTFTVSTLWAQNVKINNTMFNNYVIKTWTAADGLPGNSVNDMVQDKDGYIYISTYEGLTRFDGLDFVTINKNTDPTVSFISARSVFQDNQDNLWVGSNDEGATCIRQDGTVLSFTTKDGLPNNSVRSITQDNDNNIWIGTASGICYIKNYSEIIVPDSLYNLYGVNNLLITNIYCDSIGRVWFIPEDGLDILIYQNGSFSFFKDIKSFKDAVITEVYQDSEECMWFGIAPYYAVKIEGTKETVYNLGFGDQIGTRVNRIFQDSNKDIWFALDIGITVLSKGNFLHFSSENGLSDDKVNSIIEDKEGNIWISTSGGGIQKLSNTKFRTTHLSSTVNCIAHDQIRGCTWFGCNDGVYCLKDEEFIENNVTRFSKNIRTRDISITKDGTIYICSYEKIGFTIVSPDNTIKQITTKDGLAGEKLRVSLEASNGDLYIGSTHGLSIIDFKTGEITNITRDSGLRNDYIMCLYEDKDNRIWCGTDGGGIFILKDKQIVETITSENGLAGNIIFKIINVNRDEKWVCTGAGVSILSNGRIFNFNSANGMGTDGIFQAIKDISNVIWFTSNKGIFSVKLKDFEDVMRGQKKAVSSKYYYNTDGIISGGITSTSVSAADYSGQIWFTLIDGYAIYDPVKAKTKTYAPNARIETILIDEDEFKYDGKPIILKPNNKRIDIKYTGISFISSNLISFSTKLAGFDKTFTKWTTQRNVSYTNLKPGRYEFLLIAQNSDEKLSPNTASMIIIKEPAYYQRPAFFITLILLIITFVSAIVLIIIFRLRSIAAKRKKFSDEVTTALAATIDAKDKYTNGHSSRVAYYAQLISKKMGLPKYEIEAVFYAGLLHDIGKIGIPDNLINKEGKLTSEEYTIIKTHPSIGGEILKSISSLPSTYTAALYHHENYDGTGYPRGLQGLAIPLTARIISVADAYDAMTSNRSYRSAMNQMDTLAEIIKGKGKQFDPEIADIMIEIIKEDREYRLREKN